MPTNTPGYWRKKRPDGKTNYEHFQGTEKRKKYRTQLNGANRKNGNYGNGDGKDLHHVGNNPESKKLKTISAKTNRRMGAEKANRKRWGS